MERNSHLEMSTQIKSSTSSVLVTSWNPFSCRLSGCCGSSFFSETEYLRHVVTHLRLRSTTAAEIVEGFREQSRILTQNMYAFDCLIPQRILAAYNRQTSQHPQASEGFKGNSGSQSLYSGSHKKLPPENHSLYPVYDLVLNRFRSQEDDLIPPVSSLMSMSEILPDTPPRRQINSENCCMEEKPKVANWNEILGNHTSLVDEMRSEEILEKSEGKKEHPPRPCVPEKILPQSLYSAKKIFPLLSAPELPLKTNEMSKPDATKIEKNVNSVGDLTGSAFSSKSYMGSVKPFLKPMATIMGGNMPLSSSSYFYSSTPSTTKFKNLKSFCGKRNLGGIKTPTKVVVPATRKATGGGGQSDHFRIPGALGIRTHSFHHRESNDNSEYYSSAYILEEGLKKKRATGVIYLKPYVCPVPKCGKSYKNANGIKYHAKYGHLAPQKVQCHCGKLYYTSHGLLAHKKTHCTAMCSTECSEDDFDSSSSESPESDLGESSNTGESEEDSCACIS